MLNTARSALSLFIDNPVFEKDASVLLRSKLAPFVIGAVGVLAWLLAICVHASVEPSDAALASWGSFASSGRPMLATIVGVLLALETLLLPSLASSTLAGERERGTLPLLQVSALSPARIVAGKLAALLVTIAPFACMALPLLALASIYGGVSIANVVVAGSLLSVHAVALVAVGIGASSLVKRARVAAPLAMLFSIAPSLVAGIPGVALLVSFTDGEDAATIAPLIVVGVLAELALAAAALLLARDQLSPRIALRWPLRRVVVGFLLTALPVLAALSVSLLSTPAHGDGSDVREPVQVAVIAIVVVTGMLTLLVEICCFAGARAVDGRTSLGQALVATGLAAAGLSLARLVPGPLHGAALWHRDVVLSAAPMSAVVVMMLYVAFSATFAAAVARFVKNRAARLVVVLVALGVLLFVPIFLHGLHSEFGLSPWALGFTNPVIVVGEHADAPGSIVFFAVMSAVFALVARRK